MKKLITIRRYPWGTQDIKPGEVCSFENDAICDGLIQRGIAKEVIEPPREAKNAKRKRDP
jgi:hypothetical protein